MKKILIIGGNGFLGKNISKVIDKLKYEIFNESRITGFDLLNKDIVKNKIKILNPDIIVNLAAHVGSIEYVSKNHGTIIYENSTMALNLYQTLADLNMSNVYVINTLANCSYPGIINIQEEESWLNGKVHGSVLSFGNSKRFLQVVSECYHSQFKIKSLNLILPNAYGVYDHLEIEKVHALNGMVIRMIKSKRNNDDKFVVWGTGSPIREWIFMEDAAKLVCECFEREIKEPYLNLGSEVGISIKDSANTIKQLVGFTGDLTFDTNKPDGAPVKVLGNKLFKKYFPNFTFTNYEEGLKQTIQYYENKL